jgi:hypothetical protein
LLKNSKQILYNDIGMVIWLCDCRGDKLVYGSARVPASVQDCDPRIGGMADFTVLRYPAQSLPSDQHPQAKPGYILCCIHGEAEVSQRWSGVDRVD